MQNQHLVRIWGKCCQMNDFSTVFISYNMWTYNVHPLRNSLCRYAIKQKIWKMFHFDTTWKLHQGILFGLLIFYKYQCLYFYWRWIDEQGKHLWWLEMKINGPLYLLLNWNAYAWLLHKSEKKRFLPLKKSKVCILSHKYILLGGVSGKFRVHQLSNKIVNCIKCELLYFVRNTCGRVLPWTLRKL